MTGPRTKAERLVAELIPADDLSAGITRALTEIQANVRLLATKPASLDVADALHRTSVALNALRNETSWHRNEMLRELRPAMSYGRIARRLGMNRGNLVNMLNEAGPYARSQSSAEASPES